jgi:ribonucrease Y
MEIITIIGFIIGALGLGGAGFVWYKFGPNAKSDLKDMSEEKALKLASIKAKEKIEQAEAEILTLKEKSLDEHKKLRAELAESERLLAERESAVQRRGEVLDERIKKLDLKEEELETLKSDIKKLREKLSDKLEKVAKLTKEEAEKILMKQVDEDLAETVARKIKESLDKAEDESEEKSQMILVEAMQKSATDYVSETTTTHIELPNDELKGRIIGKEGRNIKSFETLTGVDVIIDEVPGEITLSSFDPLRREVAAIALKQLIKDGRIHPGYIEEVVQKTKENIAREIKKTGEEVAHRVGWDSLHPDLKKLLGRFKYRYSYGQNLIKHTLEVVNVAKNIAAEMGADIELVKRAALLHDIGKVMTHEVEGAHHHISGDLGRKYGLDAKLVNAIEAHHLDIEPKSPEAWIIAVADAVSGARPGARNESYENYVHRMQDLEETAKAVVGEENIKSVYAIKAGREIRVMINPKRTTDSEAIKLSHDIAKKIEETQNYPGEILVTVIRELRATDTAK